MKPGADFARGCALSGIRPAFLLTHSHPAICELACASKPYQGILAPVNRYLLLQYLVAGNMSQGRKTDLISAPLIRIYPRSWTRDTWVNKVDEEADWASRNCKPFSCGANCRISWPQVENRPIRRRASSQPYSPTPKTLSTKIRYTHPPAPLQSTVEAP
jgi:hypothetical protein